MRWMRYLKIVIVQEIFRTPGGIRPYVRTFVCLGFGVVSLVFSKFWHRARNPHEVMHKRALFSFLPQKLGKWPHYWKICQYFLRNLCYNENLYYLLFSCTNPNFGKSFIPGIWTKMFSTNQIAAFFNQPYLQSKSMK